MSIELFRRLRSWAGVARGHTLRQNANRALNQWERSRSASYLHSRPLLLEISPTKRCNISCIFCIKYRTEGPKDLSLERYNIIARVLFPTAAHVSFCTGGDPLLNPAIPEFVSIADRYGVDSSLTTNGMALTPEMAQHFVETPHMVLLALSFDGASQQMVEGIRVGLDYNRVLANMTDFLRRRHAHPGCTTQAAIRYSVMHRNLRELPETVRMWGQLGVDQVIVRYLDTIYGMDVRESLWFHQEEAKEVFVETAEMGRRYYVEVDLPDPMEGPVLDRACQMPWRFLFIDTDGAARFCYQAWEQPIGNLFQAASLDDLWNSDAYRRIRATVNSDAPYFPYCKICHVRRGAALATSHFHKTEDTADLFTF
jgi:MoaA/NifB/PqqE/SkfB family radical SAM enzyme